MTKIPMQHTVQKLLQGFAFAILLFLSSCAAETVESLKSDPIAFGRVNQINVLCDKDLWEGAVGDSLRWYYESAYPILPQPEPMFDLRHLTIEDLQKEPVVRELRTFLVVADLSDESSPTARMVREDIGNEKIRSVQEDSGMGNNIIRNKWAKNQNLIYLYGFSEDQLSQNIIESANAVAKKVQERDQDMIEATTYFNGEDETIESEIRTKMDVNMRIPEEFYVAISDEQVMWIRRETSDASSNILLRRVPYTDQSQLTKEGLKAIRDSIGRDYISSALPNTYMRINDEDLPFFVKATKLNGDYALEGRGIWDIVNDFMGGAFVSYLVHDPAKQDLLFIDAFVHAPGKRKRDMMQQLEFVLRTARY